MNEERKDSITNSNTTNTKVTGTNKETGGGGGGINGPSSSIDNDKNSNRYQHQSTEALIENHFQKQHDTIQQLYHELDTNGKGYITVDELRLALCRMGLDTDKHPQIKPIIQQFIQNLIEKRGNTQKEKPSLIHPFQYGSLRIEFEDFFNLIGNKDNENIVQRALTGQLAVANCENFCKEIAEIFESVRPNEDGKVADYIPQLAEVDANLFGLSICTVDGQKFSLGDYDYDFTIQSCAKVFIYCTACEDYSPEYVHNYVGFEPSGASFNAFTLDDNNKPHNPMINAGSIAVCSLIKPELSASKRFTYIKDRLSDFAGGEKIGFDNATFLSEKDTADRNFALGYYMQENNVFPKNKNTLHDTLDLYFQTCSILVTAEKLASMGATLANGGTCPLTNKKVVSPENVKCALQLMLSCGMYDFSGEWSISVGLPAKSGVAGACCVVIPSVMGICVFSPRLDSRGNSVRAVDFCKRANLRFKWSIFDQLFLNMYEEDEKEEEEETEKQVNTITGDGNGNGDSIEQEKTDLISQCGTTTKAAATPTKTTIY
jgi:glutaminase A